MVASNWITDFLRAVGERMIRQETYLVAPLGGGVSCKACGCIVTGESLTEHYQAHMRELDLYLSEEREAQAQARKIARSTKQEETRVENTEGFYPIPCESCGKPLPKTGKRGRPPRMHDACKNPVPATPEDDTYTPEERALLQELGL